MLVPTEEEEQSGGPEGAIGSRREPKGAKGSQREPEEAAAARLVISVLSLGGGVASNDGDKGRLMTAIFSLALADLARTRISPSGTISKRGKLLIGLSLKMAWESGRRGKKYDWFVG
ncbi:hypothetical protein ElyMa_006546500 [Elysia marginata]|uniref:Uncharacterized protein n=1 Tax=Elysia marginata TaxID=1093978 RepID=A0AAV4IBU5_9GAST|nr:hypothetical protein ElyMa_006546500 [Elysia marginata]